MRREGRSHHGGRRRVGDEGRTLLEQRGAQTAAGTRARAQAATAGADAATATAADAANQRSTDMRAHRG